MKPDCSTVGELHQLNARAGQLRGQDDDERLGVAARALAGILVEGILAVGASPTPAPYAPLHPLVVTK